MQMSLPGIVSFDNNFLITDPLTYMFNWETSGILFNYSQQPDAYRKV